MTAYINVNGDQHTLTASLTLDKLITQLALTPNTFAVALNAAFIPKSRYADTVLAEHDAVEIISAMQGG